MKAAPETQLAREISLPLLIFYGLGTILGAGIYVLVGKVAGEAGLLTPLAFLIAAIVAGITAFSYCHLASNFPRAAGEAVYLEQSFHINNLSRLTALLVIFTGMVSCATLANGFAGYFVSFIEAPETLIITLVVLIMGGIALWGISESLWLAALITVIEILGLLIVIVVCGDSLTELPAQSSELFIPSSLPEISAVLGGAFLAFYAFVGFEDMVNVVEEVKQPKKNMPRGIILAMVISSLLYVLVALVAILGMSLDELAASDAPLKDLLNARNPTAGQWVAVISLFAIINGVLTQIIMSSRVLYGMANSGQFPTVFAKVSSKTKTPWIATLAIIALTLFFALALPLVTLAKTTSFIILSVFTLVNLALWKLNKRDDFIAVENVPNLPILGALTCSGLLIFQTVQVFS